jgi:hypothetical protein
MVSPLLELRTMRFSMRHLLVVVALFAVIFGEAAYAIRLRRQINGWRVMVEDQKREAVILRATIDGRDKIIMLQKGRFEEEIMRIKAGQSE